MKKTLELYNQEFESSSGTTQQFKTFYTTFRRELIQILKELEATDWTFSMGHFYLSGFFKTKDEKIFYFSISDVRHFNDKNLLIRTAENFTDYSGGSNGYVEIDKNLKESINNIINR